MSSKSMRVLLVTDQVEPSDALLDALCARSAQGAVEVRVIAPNPAAAEWHPLHPERHAKVAQTARVLARMVPAIEATCGVEAVGFVALDHDPMDAIEQSLREEPFDEILLAIAPHGLSRRFHLDLPHRLAHLHVPVVEITAQHREAAVG